ncbi:MAG TPA: DUF5666 domain-containing protein [Anaerolineales bacterium]|nr:DUF5666 domain-containing protein [Anaerolineales bacterium]
MKSINRFKALSFFLIAAYLLAACGGTLPGNPTTAKGPKVEANAVAFTGMVQAMNGTEWTVGGQKITLDPQVALDPNIAVGDLVKVEANVSPDGAVVALKVESSANDNVVSAPSADASSTPDPASTSSPDASASQITGANQNEIFGTVEAMTADAITVNGVTYSLTQGFTEIKDALSVGDQVKLHVTVNADGTATVREIEKSATAVEDNSNSGSSTSNDGLNHDANDDNSNNHSSDDGSNHDANDDNSGGGSNSGSGGG